MESNLKLFDRLPLPANVHHSISVKIRQKLKPTRSNGMICPLSREEATTKPNNPETNSS